MAEWYYIEAGQTRGPVDDEAIRVLASVGRLNAASQLMPEVVELAMNPVLISTDSATAVDLTIRVAPARSEPSDPARRMLRVPGEGPAPVPR